MDLLAEATLEQSVESLLRRRVLDLEQELTQCRSVERRFRSFSERVNDYAFITFDPESRIGLPGSVIFTQ